MSTIRHGRTDVVDQALALLDRFGLGDLTMRRLATQLGVQPSALYHHFPNKQALLAEAADELLRRGFRPATTGRWESDLAAIARSWRDAMLACIDGAELVSTVFAWGLGGRLPYDRLCATLVDAGADDRLAELGAATLARYVLGATWDEQLHLQAGSAGAIADEPRPTSDFDDGVRLILVGLEHRLSERPRARHGAG